MAITPPGVHELTRHGHEVLVEAGAGRRLLDPRRRSSPPPARRRGRADDVWAEAELVSKVKEPIAERVRPDARRARCCSPTCTSPPSRRLHRARCSTPASPAIAYETVQLPDGALPLLAPMSEVAGRLAPQVGAYHLMRQGGGRGTLMGGVSGVYAAKVVVIGAGRLGHERGRHRARHAGRGAAAGQEHRQAARAPTRIYQGHLQTVASNASRSSGPCSTPTW